MRWPLTTPLLNGIGWCLPSGSDSWLGQLVGVGDGSFARQIVKKRRRLTGVEDMVTVGEGFDDPGRSAPSTKRRASPPRWWM
jgi:hypothetical protein